MPQLWDCSLQKYGGSEASNRRVSSIIETEAEKEREAQQKADNKKALADARSLGKGAVATVKARIAQERIAASEAKKIEKLRMTAERNAERAKMVAENKARQVEKRVCTCFFDSL